MLKNDFSTRHLGSDQKAIEQMLETLGLDNIQALLGQVLPNNIAQQAIDSLPLDGLTEQDALAKLKDIASKNKIHHSMIGMGYYNTHLPAVIVRTILENPGWYTAYNPYQAEISQGRLQMLLAFQQLIIDLTGLPIANASLLDEATAACEAMMLCARLTKKTNKQFFIDHGAHPQVIAVIKGRAKVLGIKLVIDHAQNWNIQKTFGGILYYPNTFGDVIDHTSLIQQAKNQQNIVVVGTDLMALMLLKSPAHLGADIAFGSAQRFGIPLGFGGPHAAFFACLPDYKRLIPGRIIGISKDKSGTQAYRMALQTREQHIRRDRATSNICTAQALLAILSAAYAIYHGPSRLQKIAQAIHKHTHFLATQLLSLGYKLLNVHYFDTLCIQTERAQAIYAQCLSKQINIRFVNTNTLGISCDEATTQSILANLISIFKAHAGHVSNQKLVGLPDSLLRKDGVLQHGIFHHHQTETEFLRFITRLQSKDFALDHSMIPLGSCTMKLNAATQMQALSLPEFANIHPFAPVDQTTGYRELLAEFETMMGACTGLPAVSLQPNSGAQGEYTGLLMIKAYLKSCAKQDRNVCLIPACAHGTNPASAVISGMRVVVVQTDARGNIDLDDLKAKLNTHVHQLAACMVTYPSTHGVFETSIIELTRLVHEAGGLVYLDGANLNAMVGCVLPSALGVDVMHINLHKTFCIPHGGGGPGIGVVAAAQHLAPFLPAKLFCDKDFSTIDDTNNYPVSSAPYGSALLIGIPWLYIQMMGAGGLRSATELALLNANYMKARLSKKYPIVYTNDQGYIAHEFILDIRPIKEQMGISEQDIAKRLMDYGFHAPTVSFPVVGGLMIEPTESESKAQIDQFCEAMLSIFEEIEQVKNGVWDRVDNPLKNAPHTQLDCTVDKWMHPYSRTQAAFPLTLPFLRLHKKWPAVGRIDEVFGDRNLVCGCGVPEDYVSDKQA